MSDPYRSTSMVRHAPPASVSRETLEKLEHVARLSQPGPNDGADLFRQIQDNSVALKKHNLEIISEFRLVVHELDVLKSTNAREREQHDIEMANQRAITDRAVAAANNLGKQLAEIKAILKSGGKLILDAVKAAEDATDAFPPEVQAYRPNITAEKLPVNHPDLLGDEQ